MKYAILIVFIICAAAQNSWADSMLKRISTSKSSEMTQVFLAFDRVPSFDQKRAGKRLDLIFHNTISQEGLTLFKPDDNIIKVLLYPDAGTTIFSVFFRYEPQNLEIIPGEANTLVLNIAVGDKFTKSYQELYSHLEGLALIERQQKDLSNPLVTSPYRADWKSFVSSFESPVVVKAPVHFTIPRFPLIRLILPPNLDYSTFISKKAILLAERDSWVDVVAVLEQELKSTSDEKVRTYLALTYGEILLRLGNFTKAYTQLYSLKQSHPDDQIGLLSSYMICLLLASNGDPYTADFELRNISALIKPQHPLAPHYTISLAETSLATDQLKQMAEALARDDIAYPPDLQALRELRQADLLYASGKSIKAYVAYQLADKKLDLEHYPYSLAGLCNTLYEQREYKKSIDHYRLLFKHLDDRAEQGMVNYRISMADLNETGERDRLINEFARVEDTFRGTEAAFRAALKKTDLRYLKDTSWYNSAIMYYRALGERSNYRAVSEEAFFKEALLYHLANDNSTAIELLNTFLRDFRSGIVRSSGEALLLQLLPTEIRKLIEEENYVQALTLAQRNKHFFDNNWLDNNLLADLAYAYERLGIHEEALRLYLYLMGVIDVAQREKFYLPLTQVAYNKGAYFLVEDFASQYIFNYPDGVDHEDIALLRLNALYATNQIDKAYSFLPDPLPKRIDYTYIAATLAYSKDNYPEVIERLYPLTRQEKPLPARLQFMLAESLLTLGNSEEAAPLFTQASEDEQFRSQSLFRLVQIARSLGDEAEALKLLGKIAETKNGSLWQEFAARELKLKQLTRNL